MSHELPVADPVGMLAEEFVARYRAGERPALTEYTDKHPEHAERIRQLFPMLVVMEQAGSGVTRDATCDHASDDTEEAPLPDAIGGYRVVREVGRGGMGVVYEAEQVALGRRVALKVVPLQAVTGGHSLERFRREAKAAARLHHTNIVPVYEVGEGQGVCYYAMQFIQGQPLDQVIDELRRLRSDPASGVASAPRVWEQSETGAGLGALTRPRSPESSSVTLPGQTDPSAVESNRKLFYRSVARVGVQVAEALEYAHREGVVHRDVKPSNLLLDAEGRVWVTDFGLAQAGGAALTQTGDVVGTVRYMAPERFRGWADPRSDVYALGLTLYELVALRPAFAEPDRLQLIHAVTHDEPPRLRKLDPSAPRDLETIVQKATHKEPDRRYQTAADLAADLQRFVDDEPLRARRVGTWERGWRWCRRNPALATALASVAAALVLGTSVSTAFGIQARRAAAAALAARDAEARQRKAAEDINKFWLDEVLNPAIARGRAHERGREPNTDITVLKLIDEASEKIYQAFADQPKVAADVHFRINQFYADTSFVAKGPDRWERLERGRGHLLKSLELYEQELGEEADETLKSMRGAGLLARQLGRYADATPFLERVLTIRQRIGGPGHPATTEAANELAGVYAAQQWFAAAEELRLATLADARRVQGDDASPTVTAKYGLGSLYSLQGRFAEALPLLEEALAGLRSDPKDYPIGQRASHVLNTLGVLYSRMGCYADAVDALQKAVTLHGRSSLRDSTTLAFRANLGFALLQQRQFGAAEESLRETLGLLTEKQADGWDVFYVQSLLGASLAGQGKYAAAEPELLNGYDGLKARAHDPAPRSWSASSWITGVKVELTPGESAGSAVKDAGARIVQLYEAWGQPEKAAAWRAKLAAPPPAGSPKP